MSSRSENRGDVNIRTPLGSVQVSGDKVSVASPVGSVNINGSNVNVSTPVGSVNVGPGGVSIGNNASQASQASQTQTTRDFGPGRAEPVYSSERAAQRQAAKHPDAGGDSYKEPKYSEPKYEAPPVYQVQNVPQTVNGRLPDDGKEYKIIHSPWPFVITGGFWLAYSLLFGLYKPWQIITCAAISYFVYKFAKKKFPNVRQEIIKPYEAPKSTDPDVSATITNAVSLIDSINASSAAIAPKCPSLSSNADSLVRQTRQILDYIAENTQKAPLVRRLFTYYLPTLDKLLKSWLFFDEHGEGDSMFAGKSEIEQSVAEMETVFRGQHEKLVNDAALDISAEIDVLEKMLRDSENLKA